MTMNEIGILVVPVIIGLVRDNRAPAAGTDDRLDEHDAGIRCPACRWQPARHDLWACHPGCGHAWNTFDTRGVCPECGTHWEETQCPKCGTWSAHEDWYERRE